MMNSTQSNGWRWLGLGILLAILLVLWLVGLGPSFTGGESACCGVPVATAPVAPPAVTAPVAPKPAPIDLGLLLNNGKMTLLGFVPTAADKNKLLAAAAQIYGNGNIIDKLTVSANAGLPGWWGQLSQVFDGLKGIVNHGLIQSDKVVSLTGEVASKEDIAAKQAALQALLGDVQINNLLVVTPPVAKPAPVGQPVAKKTVEPPVKPVEKPAAVKKPVVKEPAPKPSEPPVAAAEAPVACGANMNLSIYFANNSSYLGAKGQAKVQQIVKCLNRRMVVIGHTDNYGESAYNQQLSKARAKAVIGYIRSIDPAKAKLLIPYGRGEDQPIASNAHRKGRAINRRIEFVAR